MKHDLSGVDWYSVLPRFGIGSEYLRSTKKKGPCPVCEAQTGDAGKTRFVFDNKRGVGNWYCHHCGGGLGMSGDGISLIAAVNGLTYGEAIKAVFEKADYTPSPVKRDPVQEKPKDMAAIKGKLSKAWNESYPIKEGDPVWRYLHNRIMQLAYVPDGSVLRYHPGMKFWEEVEDASGNTRMVCRGTFPVMLACFRKQGKLVTLHRTYLKPDGSGKVEFDSAKKAMSTLDVMTGGAIMLSPFNGGELAVSEGIEKSLAIQTAYLSRGIHMPAWACYSKDVLKGFIPPTGVTKLHVFGDGDPNGAACAKALVKRVQATGLPVVLHHGRVDMDYDDIWNLLCQRKLAENQRKEAA